MPKKIIFAVSLWLCFFIALPLTKADECENPGGLTEAGVISGCISKFSGILDAISSANATNQQELTNLKSQILYLQSQISQLDRQLTKLSADVFDREVKLGVRRQLLAARVRQDYIRRREPSLLLLLFSADSAAGFFQDLSYRQKLTQQDQAVISSVSAEIKSLHLQAASLSSQKANLDNLKGRVDQQAEFLAAEVAKASRYEAQLSSQIAALTARQQALLAQKTGTFQTSVGEVPLADDPAARPDFNPGFSPALAAFSFGAPHYKGMSQYGAFGRSQAGQNYRAILEAYYGNVEVRKMPMPDQINTGAGRLAFEGRYLPGIAEMPTVWADQGGYEALKAQAVAARSYALAYVGWRVGSQNAPGTICVTETCQVYKHSKADTPGRWADAVRETEGEILVSRTTGEVVNAWYASTSGGYQESYTSLGHATPGFWDTTSDWTRWADGAWEVKGGSPWFYKGWYKSRSGKTCGRSHPWLTPDEFSDIVNAAMVYGGDGDTSGLFPADVRECWGSGDSPWSRQRLAQEAAKFGGPVTSVSAIRVEHGSDGVTKKVVFSTDRGDVALSGPAFVKAFNLRAPGAIHLKSGLFNIERK